MNLDIYQEKVNKYWKYNGEARRMEIFKKDVNIPIDSTLHVFAHENYKLSWKYDGPEHVGIVVDSAEFSIWDRTHVQPIIPSCVIDPDYPGEYYCWLCNFTDTVVSIPAKTIITLHISVFIPEPSTRFIYDPLVFKYLPGSEPLDNIIGLRRATTKAAAYDIIFDKEYRVEGCGILILHLPLEYCYHSRPYTFIFRSRFARAGAYVHDMESCGENVIKITIANRSAEPIELGDRFLCIIPEYELFHNEAPFIGLKYEAQTDQLELLAIDNRTKARALKP